MNQKFLEETAKQLVTRGKGILAADESNPTCDKRLEAYGIVSNAEIRRQYREMLLGVPDLGQFISGVILYDETFWQKDSKGVAFPLSLIHRKILPGIKIDLGAKDMPGFPNEKITIGLDDLAERLKKYIHAGARFTKWRAVIRIDEELGLPTDNCIKENISALARYAKIVQEHGLVPIVEPEVLLEGKHSIKKAEEVTTFVLRGLMQELENNKVYLPGTILKTSMVINGDQNPDEASPEEIATATVRTLKNTCPTELGGIVFLSGGQTAVEATAHLDAIADKEPLPWEITFSYARALQEPALRTWAGRGENVEMARAEFKKRLELNQVADAGDYKIWMEYE